MRVRRYHKKSRRGCILCKQRHLKCDEKRPQCANCHDSNLCCRYMVDCDSGAKPLYARSQLEYQQTSALSDPTEVMQPDEPSRAQIHARRQYEAFIGLEHIASRISLQPCHMAVFKLLHHYSTTVYSTLSTIPSQQEVWQTAVVQIALKHEFLLRGMLAMSALHLAHTQRDKSQVYLVEATMHQTVALTEFRDILSNTEASDGAQPLFLFSGFLTMYAFGVPAAEGRFNPKYTLRDGIDDFLTCANLARGMRTLLSSGKDGVMSTRNLEGLVRLGKQSPELPILDDQLASELLPLSKLYTSCNAEPCIETCCIYLQAIQNLQTAFVALRESRRPGGAQSLIFIALSWPITVSQEFLELLRGQKEYAVLILAYYAVLLHRVRFSWWFQGWGRKLVEIIMSALGNTHEELLSWPREMVGLA